MERLLSFRGVNLIKVIAGVRRCGKSTLLEMFRDRLVEEGVDEGSVVSLDFAQDRERGRSWEELFEDIAGRDGRTYALLDDVQTMEGWADFLLNLLERTDCDVYVAGPASRLSAWNLPTILGGRTVTLEMTPFSYREYLVFTGLEDSDLALERYMACGGFPEVAAEGDARGRAEALRRIADLTLEDVVEGRGVRNRDALAGVVGVLADEAGRPLSARSVRDRLTAAGARTSVRTVEAYMGYVEESMAFRRVEPIDIGPEDRSFGDCRFYPADPGLWTAFLGGREPNRTTAAEDLVYLELRRRGFRVGAGVLGSEELGFVATDPKRTVHVRVCQSLESESTRERELRPLLAIRDGARKVVVTVEPSLNSEWDGVGEIPLRAFLAGAVLRPSPVAAPRRTIRGRGPRPSGTARGASSRASA